LITDKYLARLTLEWCSGNRDHIRKLLVAQGKEIHEDDGMWTVRTPDFTCGVMFDSKPVDAITQLCFALLGPLWPFAVGDAYNGAMKIFGRIAKMQRGG